MLATHAAALASGNIAYHEFLLFYKASERIVYGFVEGKDDPSFYHGLIDNDLPEGWKVKLIRAGSKSNVLKVLDDMDWARFPKKRICFFVDRDLSEFLGGETHNSDNLYVSDKYSIENDIVNFGTMERVLEEVLNITGLSASETATVQTLFEANLRLFSNEMVPVMAQILLWRRAGANVSLDNIDVKAFFDFNQGQIGLNASFAAAIDRVRHSASRVSSPVDTAPQLAAAESEFRAQSGAEKYVRGKYLFWFFVQCAIEIHKAIGSFAAKHRTPPKVRLPLGVGNAMAIIGPRARCPSTLKLFLGLNYRDYIQSLGTALPS